jgi:DNA-binding LacI/PurR family transcriptional regulator
MVLPPDQKTLAGDVLVVTVLQRYKQDAKVWHDRGGARRPAQDRRISVAGVSLKDVAAVAGVSVRTVSNVVNRFPHVAPDTRARVEKALEQLNYRPNLAARSLRRGRSGLIGLVVPEVDSPYFSELAAHLVLAAEERSWTVLVDQTGGDPARERAFLEGAAAAFVDGLVFSPWGLGATDLRRSAEDTPLVLLGERTSDGVADHIAIDNVAAAAAATDHLISLGRRRIAAIGAQPHLSNETARLRLEGYRASLLAAGHAWDERLAVRVAALHRADGAAAMQGLLSLPEPPDAVFCFNDQLALGAIRAAHDAGLVVPRDLAVVGFDDIEDGRYSSPTLTTISPDKWAIAVRALECLAERLDGDRSDSARDIVVPHRLIVRESSGVPPESAAPGC